MLQKEHPLLQPAASGGLGSTLCELLLLTCSWVCVNQQVQEPISSRSSFILLPFVFFFFGLIPHCFTPRSSGLCNFCNPVAVQSVLQLPLSFKRTKLHACRCTFGANALPP